MIQFDKKGQTALEYLLIVVVAIIVVVAVMVWMNSMSGGTIHQANQTASTVLCETVPCSTVTQCDANPNCKGIDTTIYTVSCGSDGTCSVD